MDFMAYIRHQAVYFQLAMFFAGGTGVVGVLLYKNGWGWDDTAAIALLFVFSLFFITFLVVVHILWGCMMRMKKRDGVLLWLGETNGRTLGALYALESNGSPVLDVLDETNREDILLSYKEYLKVLYENELLFVQNPGQLKVDGQFLKTVGKKLLEIEQLPTWKEMEADKVQPGKDFFTEDPSHGVFTG